MENCSLILSIPHQNTTETQVIIYGEAFLDIKEPLNRHTLSWNNRPPSFVVALLSLFHPNHVCPNFMHVPCAHHILHHSQRRQRCPSLWSRRLLVSILNPTRAINGEISYVLSFYRAMAGVCGSCLSHPRGCIKS